MAGSVKDVLAFGRRLQLSGEPHDPYFVDIEGAIAGLAALQAWVARNLAPDATVIDAGGNIGLTALLLSTCLPAGHVHVFEANPVNARHLQQNIARNGVTNCTVIGAALGHREDAILVAGAGASSHVVTVIGLDDHGLTRMTTLDNYQVEAGLQRVDFIKMDVEGYEPAVLDGAAELIKRFSPRIWMEFNSWCLMNHHGFSPRQFAQQLWHAFEVYTPDPTGAEHRAGQGDPVAFLHANIVFHGAVDDVLLYPKAVTHNYKFGERATVLNDAMVTEIEQLRSQIDAMLHSTSWRVTTPIRAVGRLLRMAKSGRQRPYRA